MDDVPQALMRITREARPLGGFSVLETQLANWNGSSTDPLVPGTYVQTAAPTGPGLFSENIIQYGSGCVVYGWSQAGSGNIRVDSFGGFQTGAHLVAEVDLKFGDDHLSGKVDGVYCGVIQHICRDEARGAGGLEPLDSGAWTSLPRVDRCSRDSERRSSPGHRGLTRRGWS